MKPKSTLLIWSILHGRNYLFTSIHKKVLFLKQDSQPAPVKFSGILQPLLQLFFSQDEKVSLHLLRLSLKNTTLI